MGHLCGKFGWHGHRGRRRPQWYGVLKSSNNDGASQSLTGTAGVQRADYQHVQEVALRQRPTQQPSPRGSGKGAGKTSRLSMFGFGNKWRNKSKQPAAEADAATPAWLSQGALHEPASQRGQAWDRAVVPPTASSEQPGASHYTLASASAVPHSDSDDSYVATVGPPSSRGVSYFDPTRPRRSASADSTDPGAEQPIAMETARRLGGQAFSNANAPPRTPSSGSQRAMSHV